MDRALSLLALACCAAGCAREQSSPSAVPQSDRAAAPPVAATKGQQAERPGTRLTIYSGDYEQLAAGADFIVDAALVSRVHCRLTSLPDGGLEVKDLDSTNGTFVNGERVDSARLSHGDRLQVGRLELMVENGAETDDDHTGDGTSAPQ